MDFFQAQDDARKVTKRLVVLFLLAVLTLIVMTNILVMAVVAGASTYSGGAGQHMGRAIQSNHGYGFFSDQFWETFFQSFDWQVFGLVGIGVIVVVAGGSVYKIAALSSGGKSVAEMLGGRRISRDSNDLDEKKILNVVEEMSIASGTPVPTVYLLPEAGINAFAAGFTPGDAVIGVTKGCIHYLNRDELQGVIAHEFSHILNGDMRLNIRLIGLLNGILVIGMIGYYLLRTMRYSGRRRNDGAAAILVLGLGLMAIGFGGSFFGSLIKASVSRQREYLADSSAVQFTRNPDGIAGALKKIGGLSAGSLLESPAAPQMSHAYFANGIKSKFTSLFATHPPLNIRIKRIQPAWDGKFPETALIDKTAAPAESKKETPAKEKMGKAVAATAAVVTAASAVNNVGRPDASHLQYARDLIEQVPDTLLEAMREPYGARALIYCFVINKDAEVRQGQLDYLQQHGDEGIHSLTAKLLLLVDTLDKQFRLPLVDGSMAALRQLSPQQYQLFKKNLTALIEADNKIALFEWALQKIIFRHLDGEFVKHAIFAKTAKYTKLSQVKNEIAILLSLLVYAEHKNQADAENAFSAGNSHLDEIDLQILHKTKIDLTALDDAIDKLNLLKPLAKPQVLKACAACIGADNNVSVGELELLRAFSSALDCPMPLLMKS
jgi:Zn-dependent protease with chaperone function